MLIVKRYREEERADGTRVIYKTSTVHVALYATAICTVMTVAAAWFWMIWGGRLPICSAAYGALSAAVSTSKPLTVSSLRSTMPRSS